MKKRDRDEVGRVGDTVIISMERRNARRSRWLGLFAVVFWALFALAALWLSKLTPSTRDRLFLIVFALGFAGWAARKLRRALQQPAPREPK
jgi:hypothetical protein